MHGGISILLLRGGGGMDINIYFDTTSFILYNYTILVCTRYSFGVHPATFLNNRLK